MGAAAGIGLAAGWPGRGDAAWREQVDSAATWLTETPRELLLDRILTRVRGGLEHDLLAAAITQAAARGVQPYPQVGFKYHAVMVMHPVYQAMNGMPPGDRILPLIWAADYFKRAQEQELSRSGWRMTPLAVRPPSDPRRALERAFDDWDRDAADAAILGFADTAPADDVFDLLYRYAARDFRAIGHKTIAACNAQRMLGPLDWENRGPLLRSLVAAIQNHEGQSSPATHPGAADEAWRRNRSRVVDLPPPRGAVVEVPAAALLEMFRDAGPIEASDFVFDLIAGGADRDSIWQGMTAYAGELMLRRSGIISVHANTTVQAMRYAYFVAASHTTRALVLLQCASFLPGFRDLLPARQRELRIDSLEPLPPDTTGDEQLEEIFADVSDDRVRATRKALAYLQNGGSEDALEAHARHYVVYNTTGSHDYKFVDALFENRAWMRPPLRNAYLASGTLYYNGSGDRQNAVISNALTALGR